MQVMTEQQQVSDFRKYMNNMLDKWSKKDL